MRAVLRLTPPATGVAPPASPVPAPRGTIGTPCFERTRITADAWAVSRGSTTSSGSCFSRLRASDS